MYERRAERAETVMNVYERRAERAETVMTSWRFSQGGPGTEVEI